MEGLQETLKWTWAPWVITPSGSEGLGSVSPVQEAVFVCHNAHMLAARALARSQDRSRARTRASAPANTHARTLARSHAVNGHVSVVAGGCRPDHAARGGRPGDIRAVSSFRLVRQIMSERAASVRRTFGFALRGSPAGVPTRAMQVQSTSLAEIKVVRAPLPDRNGGFVYAHWWRSQSRAAGFARWFAHVPCAVGGHGC